MSNRREPDAKRIADVQAAVQSLRAEGRARRVTLHLEGDESQTPPGGWAPILDDEGYIIPDPPPDQSTDVPADVVDEAKRANP